MKATAVILAIILIIGGIYFVNQTSNFRGFGVGDRVEVTLVNSTTYRGKIDNIHLSEIIISSNSSYFGYKSWTLSKEHIVTIRKAFKEFHETE